MPATLTPEQQDLIELAARVPLQEVPPPPLQSLIVDPVWLACATAPPDDEPVAAEDLAAVEAGTKNVLKTERMAERFYTAFVSEAEVVDGE